MFIFECHNNNISRFYTRSVFYFRRNRTIPSYTDFASFDIDRYFGSVDFVQKLVYLFEKNYNTLLRIHGCLSGRNVLLVAIFIITIICHESDTVVKYVPSTTYTYTDDSEKKTGFLQIQQKNHCMVTFTQRLKYTRDYCEIEIK